MSPWFAALIAGPAVLIPLAAYSFSRRRVRGAHWYGLLLLAIAFWSLAYAWELATPSLEAKRLALKVKYLAVVALPPGWIGFILAFVGAERRAVRARVWPLWGIALLASLVLWTNEWHGWFWGSLAIQDVGGFAVLRGRGPGFWLNTIYTYVVLGAGLALLLVHAVHSPYLYRRRAAILIAGTVVPWAGNVVFLVHPEERLLDPTPFLFTCTALIAALAVFRYGLFEPAPTLRDARIGSVGDGVVILDRHRRIADLNPAAEAVLGRRRPEAAGEVIDALVASWPSGELPDAQDITFGDGAARRVYDVRCSPVRSLAGEPTGAVVIFRDVTERRAAEAALRDSEQRYRAVIEQAFDGVWLSDWQGTIVDANPQAAVLVGGTASDLVGRSIADFIERGQGPASPSVEVALRRGDAVAWEAELVGTSGRRVLVAGRSKQIGPALVVTTMRDVTDERTQAALRERLLNEAQDANKLKDAFLATVSHELRTPLNAVVGWTAMLARRQQDDQPLAHALAVIERNALAQARLIEDLLDLSRLTAGAMRLAVSPISLGDIVADAVDAVAPSGEAKRLAVHVDVPPDLPLVQADPDRVRQVIWNLLSNAIKFTPAGGRISLRAEAADEGVAVTVADTGVGMAPDFLPHVFDAFRQADSGDARRARGLGLGLTIVRHIVEAHGGRIEARSEGVGRGAAFTFWLPGATGGPRLDTSVADP